MLASDRSNTSGLCLRSSSGTVPVGTTKVLITMTFTNLTPGGPYKRHVYNAVIRIVNPSSRRES